MRLVSIGHRVHALTGALDDPGTEAVDLGAAADLPAEPSAFLASGGLQRAARAVARARAGLRRSVAGIRLDAPVPAPRIVWAVGLNYRDHAAETGRPPPEAPALFTKSPGAVIAHGEPIVVPRHVDQPDYEGEIAFVIGRVARDVSESEALDHVAGITIAHDVSARDHQFTTGQFSWSKSFDTFCPFGPVLVTLDELQHDDLPLETRLNGEVVQSARSTDLVHSIPRLVAWISQGLTMQPGDVVLTGTPAGVGAARRPPRWLRDGDVVEITVGGVGTLRNPVVRASSPDAGLRS
jgi:2-keto-4-pentenoate hydratase/2-oxohepta-3-ene-1,7-dioic acid hydratase in catechol pathway